MNRRELKKLRAVAQAMRLAQPRKFSTPRGALRAAKRARNADQGQHPKFPPARKRRAARHAQPSRRQVAWLSRPRPLIVERPLRRLKLTLESKGYGTALVSAFTRFCQTGPKHQLDAIALRGTP